MATKSPLQKNRTVAICRTSEWQEESVTGNYFKTRQVEIKEREDIRCKK
jgi:hypothetical protein